MSCPVCNAENSAMDARCLGCGTILIREAVGRSDEVQRTVNAMDKRLYMGYGGLAGFVIGFGSWFALSQDEGAVKTWLMLSCMTGAAFGRFLAWRRRAVL